jgi:hypothetical protein
MTWPAASLSRGHEVDVFFPFAGEGGLEVEEIAPGLRTIEFRAKPRRGKPFVDSYHDARQDEALTTWLAQNEAYDRAHFTTLAGGGVDRPDRGRPAAGAGAARHDHGPAAPLSPWPAAGCSAAALPGPRAQALRTLRHGARALCARPCREEGEGARGPRPRALRHERADRDASRLPQARCSLRRALRAGGPLPRRRSQGPGRIHGSRPGPWPHHGPALWPSIRRSMPISSDLRL